MMASTPAVTSSSDEVDVVDAVRAASSAALLAELARRGVDVSTTDAVAPRGSSHVVGALRPKDALSDERAAQLDAALAKIGVDAENLLSGPPLKAYNSFVRPRDPEAPASKTLSAENAAHQIGFLQRHEATRRADHVRNTDAAARRRRALDERPHPVTLILDNVRSAENVGSLFRTADCARCAELVTCGFTPHPLATAKIAKTAAGAETAVAHRHFDSTLDAVAALKKRGALVWVLETHDLAVPVTEAPLSRLVDPPAVAAAQDDDALDDVCCSDNAAGGGAVEETPRRTEIAVVLGNEVTGVNLDVVALADAVVEIPTYGTKNSMNVACVGAIVIYDILRRWALH